MIASIDIERLVRERSNGRCEYCQMHQSLQGATFHVEHVIPLSKGGDDRPENLAIACPGCNLSKSDRVTAEDPETEVTESLFHPRCDEWSEHFQFVGTELVGLTSVGRATIAALNLNHTRRRSIREAEAVFGLFPPSLD